MTSSDATAASASPLAARALWLTELRATFQLSWPLVLANLGQIAMTATDVAMMGRLGHEALAAGALGFNIHVFFFIFGLGVLSAVTPLLASELGRRRFAVREVRRTVRQGLWSAVVLAVPSWAVLWHADTLLAWLGQSPDLIPDATVYARSVMWSLLPGFAFVVMRSFVVALQRPGWALTITLGAVALNAFANWVLMFGQFGLPALGIMGAGIATTLVNVVMVAAFATVLTTDRRFRRYRLFGRWWRADRSRFLRIWSLGLPLGATLIFEVAIFNAAVFLMGLIGPTALAAHQIAIQIASITFMVPMGLGQAVTVRVGLAAGGGDRDGVARAAQVALTLAIGFMGAMAVVMVAMPLPLIGVFVDRHAATNEAVVALAVQFLILAAVFQVVDGAQAVAIGMLRGLHDTRVPMMMALFGYWGIGFPLGALLAFPAGLGGVGVWIGLAAGLAVVALLLLLRWRRRNEWHDARASG